MSEEFKASSAVYSSEASQKVTNRLLQYFETRTLTHKNVPLLFSSTVYFALELPQFVSDPNPDELALTCWHALQQFVWQQQTKEQLLLTQQVIHKVQENNQLVKSSQLSLTSELTKQDDNNNNTSLNKKISICEFVDQQFHSGAALSWFKCFIDALLRQQCQLLQASNFSVIDYLDQNKNLLIQYPESKVILSKLYPIQQQNQWTLLNWCDIVVCAFQLTRQTLTDPNYLLEFNHKPNRTYIRNEQTEICTEVVTSLLKIQAIYEPQFDRLHLKLIESGLSQFISMLISPADATQQINDSLIDPNSLLLLTNSDKKKKKKNNTQHNNNNTSCCGEGACTIQ